MTEPKIKELTNRIIVSVVFLIEIKNYCGKRKNNIFAKTRNMRWSFGIQRKHLAEKTANPQIMKIHFHTFRHWKGTTLQYKTKDLSMLKQFLATSRLQAQNDIFT